ncbi:MAG: M20/M25/M40 family metallo-hydrolase [Chloroflexota bacterium]
MQPRTRKPLPWYVTLVGLFAFTTLACTLAADNAPPTLAPRVSATPPPTIGYATIAPGDAPANSTVVATPAAAAPQAPAASNLNALMNQVQSDRLMAHVRNLQGFYTRHVNSQQDSGNRGIGAAERYIDAEFRAIAANSQGRMSVFGQDFALEWAGVRTTQTNVIAVIRGDEPGAGTIVIGAHYDSRGNDDTDAVGYAPGANDNGTGVAALIEMARVMSQRPHRATVVFVAFSAEEVGRQGSIAFVNNYIRANNIDLTAYINVDAIGSQRYADGRVNDRQIRVFSQGPNDSSPSRQLARFTETVALNYVPQMEIVVQDALDRRGRYGDHFSFTEAGYPAVRFIEMAENTAYLDTTDTIDGVSPGYFQRATQTILTVVTVMADGLQPPTNITLRDNGNGTQTLVWNAVPNAGGYLVALRTPDSMIFQQFETTQNSVTWDGFAAYESIAVAAKDSEGLMGPLSPEIYVSQTIQLAGNP